MVRFEASVVLGIPFEYLHGRSPNKHQTTKSNLTLGSYREIKELDQGEEEEADVKEYYLRDNCFSASVHYKILENSLELTVEVHIWRDAFQVRHLGGGRPFYGRTVHMGHLTCVAFSVGFTKTLSTESLLQLNKERCSIVVNALSASHSPSSGIPAVLYGPRETLPEWRPIPSRSSQRSSSASSSSSTESTASSSSELQALRHAAPTARLQEMRAQSFPRTPEEAALRSERTEPFQQLFTQASQVQEVTNEEMSTKVSLHAEEEGSLNSMNIVSEEPSFGSTSLTSERPIGLDSRKGMHKAAVLYVVPLMAHRQFCRRALGAFQTQFHTFSRSKTLESQRSSDKTVASQTTHETRDTTASQQSPPSKTSGLGSRVTRVTSKGSAAGGGGGKSTASLRAAPVVQDGLPLRLEGACSKFFSDMRAFYLQPPENGDSAKSSKSVQMNALVSASNLMNESQKAHLNPLMVHVTALYNIPAEILRVHGLERVLVRLRLPELDCRNVETAARGVEKTVRFDESLAALTVNVPNDRLIHHLNHKSLIFEVVGVRSKEWRPPAVPLMFGQASSDANYSTRPPMAAAGVSAVMQAGACGLRAALRPPPEPEVLLAVACVDASPLTQGVHTRQFCQPLQRGVSRYTNPDEASAIPEMDRIMQGWIAVTGDSSPGYPDFSGNLAYEGFSADPPANSSPVTCGDFIESASYLQVEVSLVCDPRDSSRASKTPADTAAGAGSGSARTGVRPGPATAAGTGMGSGAGSKTASATETTPNSSEAGFQTLLAVLWERRAAVRLAAAALSINRDALGAFPSVHLISELAPQNPSAMLLHRSLRAPLIELDTQWLASLRHRLGYKNNTSDDRITGIKLPLKSKKENDFAFVAALTAAASAIAGEKKPNNIVQESSSDSKDGVAPSKGNQVALKPHEAVTGFIIDGIDIYYIFVEAPPGRSMQPFLQEAVTLRPEEGRLLYHSELRSPVRRYEVFLPIGGILSVVLRSPLTEMLRQKPTTLLRGTNVAACWEALWRLDLLRRVKVLRQVLQKGLLPSPRALFSLSREYGVPLRPAMVGSRDEPPAPPLPSVAPRPEAPPRAAARKVLDALWPHTDCDNGGVRPTEYEMSRPGFGRRGRIHAVAHVLGALQGAPPSTKPSTSGAAAPPASRALAKRPLFLCKSCKKSPPLPWILNTATCVPPPPVLPSFKKAAFKSLIRMSNIEGSMEEKLGRPFSVLEEETMWSERDLGAHETPLKPPTGPEGESSHLPTRPALVKGAEEATVSGGTTVLTDSVLQSSQIPRSGAKPQSKDKKSSSMPPSTPSKSISKRISTDDSQDKKKSVEDAGDKKLKKTKKGKKSESTVSHDTEVSEPHPKGEKASMPSTGGTISTGIPSSSETSEVLTRSMKTQESASSKRVSGNGKGRKKERSNIKSQ